MIVTGAADIDAPQLTAVRDLLARRAAFDGHPALPDPLRTAVDEGTLASHGIGVLLATEDDAVLGCGFVATAADGSRSLHVLIEPSQRSIHSEESIGDAIVEQALSEAQGRYTLHLWAMRATEADNARAARLGFRPERALVQMRVGLPLPPAVTAGVPPLATRPFEPGRDDAVWLDVNNRAFAGHLEQGDWTAEKLHERLAADWVDLRGFLVADAPDGHGMVGSCWTKIHRHSVPALGEIYVISVDPERHGHGWGKALTIAGLAWLASQGISTGMLYTEADNTAALKLYSDLGFAIDHTDRSYVHAASG